MRALVISILAAALGVAAAWGANRYEFRQTEIVVPVRNASAAEPKVLVEDSNTFEFGTMQLGETRHHTFVLRNVGNAPLELTAGKPSCKCTVSELPPGLVQPGETREVKVSWTPLAVEDKFRQKAPIHTNDPEHLVVDLRIGGRVSEAHRIEPNPVNLGQFSPTETITQDINVWGFNPTPWKLAGFQCLDADTASYFNLEPRDMTAEEISRNPGAVNGQILKLTVKAGLPLGQLRQRLSITYNDEQSKPLELPIEGKAVGDISVIGKDFNTSGEYVDLGNVPSDTGRKSKLFLLIKGPFRNQVKLKVKEVDPAPSLKASLGEPVALGGKSVNWPLTIEIPPGTEPVNRLGSEIGRMARIELETGTPDVSNCVIKVRFSVTSEN